MENNNFKSNIEFKLLSYCREYFQGNKFLGREILDKPDRDTIGYYGRKYFILENDITIRKGTKDVTLKKGISVYTEMNILNGKRIK